MVTKYNKLFKLPVGQSSEKEDIYVYKQWRYKPIPQPKLKQNPPAYVDLKAYIKNNCENKIQILDRATFYEIKQPIVIMFNHFREKCAYHTKWLDKMYQLALNYGDRIVFMAADMIDMDIMFPGRNPLSFFFIFVRPEDETPNTYAIDENKCVHELLDVYKELPSLTELCENLLKGKLFPSQPLPENNAMNLVKICVHHNHQELVSKSTNNIFLIIHICKLQDNEINYDKVALALKDYKLDVVYMEAEHNYIPFEYYAYGFPTMIFIPHNDKKNFVYYEGITLEDQIIEFLKTLLEQPEYLTSLQQQQKCKMKFQPIQVPSDFCVDYNKDLAQFLLDNYGDSIKIIERQLLDQSENLIIIAFMDFQQNCSIHHVKWFNKLYQVATRLYGCTFYVADFKDIDVINTKWNPKDLIITAQGQPKIYGLDRLKHSFEFTNFNSISSLFYFADSLEYGDFYYSQDYSRSIERELVKDWPANYFNFFLKSLKKHIFITFYYPDDENTVKLLSLLEDIVQDVTEWHVEVVKFNVKLNYVDLEYKHDNYPVHYFIGKNNKRESILYVDSDLSKEKMLKFIKINVENSK